MRADRPEFAVADRSAGEALLPKGLFPPDEILTVIRVASSWPRKAASSSRTRGKV